MVNNVFLSLGTNEGNRADNINRALEYIEKDNDIIAASSLYETEPWGYKEQNDFYNMIVNIRTKYRPMELLKYVKNIEKDMGRKQTKKWGPRIIDIDILLYNDIIINNKKLYIPHRELCNRYFLLIALYEIDKNIKIPPENNSIEFYMNRVKPMRVRLLNKKIYNRSNK